MMEIKVQIKQKKFKGSVECNFQHKLERSSVRNLSSEAGLFPLNGLAGNSLHMLHFRNILFTRARKCKMCQFSLKIATVPATSRCPTALCLCKINFCTNSPSSKYIG